MDCDECGSAVFLNGPVRSLKCSACHSELELDASDWKDLLEGGDLRYPDLHPDKSCRGSMMFGGRRYVYKYGAQIPRCPSCKTDLDLTGLAPGSDGDISCKSCGSKTETFPVPDWLRVELPRALQLFGAMREGEPEDVQPDTQALKPVMMSCLNCGGGLEISRGTERITVCGYCDVELYVPDDIWRRMHPIRKRTPWYVFFGEPTQLPAAVPAQPQGTTTPEPMTTCAKCGATVPRSSTFFSGDGEVCNSCYLTL